ncbi:MAG: FixH family protein [Rhodobacter sp.]|nr:FixH family protein [Rhodobacter sp.]
MTERRLTGRAVFLILSAGFGVVIGVNAIMATLAVGTFPGLEARNPYVVSQTFDADRDAQLALGWRVSVTFDAGILRLSILDATGSPVEPAVLAATLGRATHVRDDIEPEFSFDGMAHVASVDLAPGNWNLRFEATADDGSRFRQRIVLYVDDRT